MEECAIGLMNFDLLDGLGSAPTLFLIAAQYVETADSEEMQNELIKVAAEGDNLEKVLSRRDNW